MHNVHYGTGGCSGGCLPKEVEGEGKTKKLPSGRGVLALLEYSTLCTRCGRYQDSHSILLARSVSSRNAQAFTDLCCAAYGAEPQGLRQAGAYPPWNLLRLRIPECVWDLLQHQLLEGTPGAPLC